MKSEGATALRLLARVRDHGIARRRANPLADAVAHPDHRQLPDAADGTDPGPDQRRQRVSEDHESLASPRPIRPPAGPQLEQTGNRVGQTLDHPQRELVACGQSQQEAGQQRKDHLAGDVVQQTGQTENANVARQGWCGRRGRVVGGHRRDASWRATEGRDCKLRIANCKLQSGKRRAGIAFPICTLQLAISNLQFLTSTRTARQSAVQTLRRTWTACAR